MTAEDWRFRFYAGNPTGNCTRCGSLGPLYHFDGHEDICPFCVIELAREPLKLKTEALIASMAEDFARGRLGLSTDEALRALNDSLNDLYPERMSTEQRRYASQ